MNNKNVKNKAIKRKSTSMEFCECGISITPLDSRLGNVYTVMV